jgi:hypothetical protein
LKPFCGDQDEFAGAHDWQRSQHHLIEQREDRRIGADPERHREHRNRREARIAAQQTAAIHHVLPQALEHHQAVVFVLLLPDARDVAKLAHRYRSRLLRSSAGRDLILDLVFQIRVELAGEISVAPFPLPESRPLH